jgi:flavin-dependent dehydrogenase
MADHYDAIIVGGRNAGASLAMRLAQQGLKVFLADRASFPSVPQVPSSPILHAGAMRLLDELGFDEKEYTHPDGIITEYVLNFVGHFVVSMPTDRMGIDRNYAYGLDRLRSDVMLWERAAKTSNVTARSSFSAIGLQRDNGRVTGIVGKDASGDEVRLTSDVVVGADGRFSWLAREVGAKAVEERNEYVGNTYHAEWENVEPLSPDHPHALALYNTVKGLLVIFIPIETRKYIVASYLTKERANFGPQKVESAYLEGLQSIPEVWARLKNAKKVTQVVGVKGIENGYRTPYGDGWVLAGDSVHYKDPIDGQGIYDALLGTKILAEAIRQWKLEKRSWEEAMSFYRDELWKATHSMFVQTAERVKQEVYGEPPPFVIKTLIRWSLSDPDYQRDFLRYIHRDIEPSERPTPNIRFYWRGIKRDLRGR